MNDFSWLDATTRYHATNIVLPLKLVAKDWVIETDHGDHLVPKEILWQINKQVIVSSVAELSGTNHFKDLVYKACLDIYFD